jgi:hypothetical protein
MTPLGGVAVGRCPAAFGLESAQLTVRNSRIAASRTGIACGAGRFRPAAITRVWRAELL